MRIANAVRDSLIALTGVVAIVYTSMDIPTVGENTATAASGLTNRPTDNPSPSSYPQHFAVAPGLSNAEDLELSSLTEQDSNGAVTTVNAAAKTISSQLVRTDRPITPSRRETEIASLDPYALHVFEPEGRMAMETDAPMMPNIPSAPVEPVVPPPTPRLGAFPAPNFALAANKLTERKAIVGVFGEADNAVPHHLAGVPPPAAVLGPFGSESVVYARSTNGVTMREEAERSKVGGINFGNGGIGGNGFKGIQNPSKSALVLPVVLSELPARYTTEAERARIQGEVTLQVRFLANGQVQVIRVVNGLGHGLDEEARHVAEQIRFKPALRNGEPVDHTTLVHVTFQLA